MASAPHKCPKCKATGTMEAESERKGGFSVGKAVVGGVLTGGIGLVAGGLGKKKITYVCTKCGYRVEK